MNLVAAAESPLEEEVSPSAEPEQPGLHKTAVRAFGWTVLAYGVSQVLRLAQNIALSYFVFPEAFGLFTLVNIALQGLFMFSELGVGPSIVQHKHGEDRDFYNTAWTIQIIRSFVLLAAACLIAYPMAQFYDERLLWVLPVAGFTALFDGFTSTGVFGAQRRLQIGKLAGLDALSQLIGSVAAVLIAVFITPTVWALLSATCFAMATRMVVSHFLIPGTRNRLCWNKYAAGEVISFGKWILLSTIVAFCSMQVDRLVLGKIVSTAVLGVYGVAYAISMLPDITMQKLASNVLHPVLANYRRESLDALQTKFARMRELLLVISLFLVLGVFSWSEVFFTYVYHTNYIEAGPIAKFLAVNTWISAITTTLVHLVFVVNDSKSLAKSSAVKFVTTFVFSLAGYQLGGIFGFIVAIAIGNLCGHLVLLLALQKSGISCYGQNAKFTALFIGLAATVEIGNYALDQLIMPEAGLIVNFVVCAAVGVWAMTKALEFAKEKNSQDQPLAA